MKLTPKQAAERAGVSVAMVYQWCDERRLSHYRAGGRGKRGRILIDDTDLDAFLRSLKVEADGQPKPSAPEPPKFKLRHLSL